MLGCTIKRRPSAAAPARPALDTAHLQMTIRGAHALAFATDLQVAYPSAGCHLQAPWAIVSLCLPRPNNVSTWTCLALPVTPRGCVPHATNPRPLQKARGAPSHTNHSHSTLQTHPEGARQSNPRSMLEHLCVASCWGLLRHLPRCQPHGPACLHSRHLLRQIALPDLVFCCNAVCGKSTWCHAAWLRYWTCGSHRQPCSFKA